MTCPAILKLWATYPEMASFADRVVLFSPSDDMTMLVDQDFPQRIMVIEGSARLHQMLNAMKELTHEWIDRQIKSPVDFLQAGIESILLGELEPAIHHRELLDMISGRDRLRRFEQTRQEIETMEGAWSIWIDPHDVEYEDRAGKQTWQGKRPPKYLNLKQRRAWHAPQRKHKRGKSKK